MVATYPKALKLIDADIYRSTLNFITELLTELIHWIGLVTDVNLTNKLTSIIKLSGAHSYSTYYSLYSCLLTRLTWWLNGVCGIISHLCKLLVQDFWFPSLVTMSTGLYFSLLYMPVTFLDSLCSLGFGKAILVTHCLSQHWLQKTGEYTESSTTRDSRNG